MKYDEAKNCPVGTILKSKSGLFRVVGKSQYFHTLTPIRLSEKGVKEYTIGKYFTSDYGSYHMNHAEITTMKKVNINLKSLLKCQKV